MSVKKTANFETIAHRVIHRLSFMYSKFVPIQPKEANEQCQKKLHDLMKQLIDKLYENPGLLNLPGDKDEAYEWWQVNNMRPELDKVYSLFSRVFTNFIDFCIFHLYTEK